MPLPWGVGCQNKKLTAPLLVLKSTECMELYLHSPNGLTARCLLMHWDKVYYYYYFYYYYYYY